jgi:hypothetical protein
MRKTTKIAFVQQCCKIYTIALLSATLKIGTHLASQT